jgi:hypothetical protein
MQCSYGVLLTATLLCIAVAVCCSMLPHFVFELTVEVCEMSLAGPRGSLQIKSRVPSLMFSESSFVRFCLLIESLALCAFES